MSIAELRKLAWAGIPNDLRPIAWQLLLVCPLFPHRRRADMFLKGYLPLPAPLRSATLTRKRGEYLSLVELAFARDREGLDQQIWHQIEIDVPRTRPGVPLWMHGCTQRVSFHCAHSHIETNGTIFVCAESRAYFVRLGHPTPCQWICPRNKRPCNAILPSFFISIHWYELLLSPNHNMSHF
jgi:hypothetical protein